LEELVVAMLVVYLVEDKAGRMALMKDPSTVVV
jgi:hypothetical protein